jgi:hypothetical protein
LVSPDSLTRNNDVLIVSIASTDVDDIEATNEFIVSQGAQRLSMEDIEAFKKKGMTGKASFHLPQSFP